MTERRSTVVLCVCLLLFFVVADSRNVPKEADASDGCKVKHKFYKVGEEWHPRGVCERHTCHKGGTIAAVTCPLVRIPEHSKCFQTDKDFSKSWPECCGRVICPPY